MKLSRARGIDGSAIPAAMPTRYAIVITEAAAIAISTSRGMGSGLHHWIARLLRFQADHGKSYRIETGRPRREVPLDRRPIPRNT